MPLLNARVAAKYLGALKKPHRFDQQWSFHVVVVSIMVMMAAVVRLYALGKPLLLHDEALVVDTATRSFAYIVARSFTMDAHPPFYYFLYKILELFTKSEFFLRLLSAACGIASVWVLYRLCSKFLSRSVGVVAASLLAVDLVPVAISRVVRPHSLVLLLGLICAYRLLCFLAAPSRKNSLLLWLPNVLVSLWHFNGMLVIGSQLAILAGFGVARRLPWRPTALALLANGLCLLVPFFFLLARLGQFPGVAVGNEVTMLWTFRRTLENIFEIVSLMPYVWSGIAVLGFLVLGGVALLQTKTRLAVVIAALAFLPLLVLITMRYGIIYQAQHIAYIAPFLFIFMAVGLLQTKIPAEIIALCVLAIGGYSLFTSNAEALFSLNAESINNNVRQRQIYGELPARLAATDIVGFYPNSRIDAVNWEYAKAGTGDLRQFSVTPHDPFVQFYLVKQLPYHPQDGERMFGIEKGGFAQLVDASIEDSLRVTGYRLERTPTLAFEAVPASFTVTAAPEDFFRRAYAARDLMPTFSPLGNALSPARYDAPASFSFAFENRQALAVPSVDIQIDLEDSWPENTFAVTYRFDDEPPQAGLVIRDTVFQGTAILHLSRPRPFKTLTLTFQMTCSSTRPSFYNNPDTLFFRSLQVTMRDADAAFDSALPGSMLGLDVLESNGTQLFRWSYGPETILRFPLGQGQPLQFDCNARSPIPGQTVTFVLNGREIPECSASLGPAYSRATCAFVAPAGDNVLALRYGLYNHGSSGNALETFEKDDPRPLAASYTVFRLHPAAPPQPELPRVGKGAGSDGPAPQGAEGKAQVAGE